MTWTTEQVEAIAPSPAAITAAKPLASPSHWSDLGADDRVLWGSCRGRGAEPYATMVDHVGVGFRCTCPSRRTPCKHALALLLLWSQEQVPSGNPSSTVERWIGRRVGRAVDRSSSDETARRHGSGGSVGDDGREPTTEQADTPDPPPQPDEERDRARDDRVEKMFAGLTELDRWLDDRIRTGLADPALAKYSTWDDLAARLVDAQAGSLANRIRRIAGLVGASPDWHDDVLAELGMLHLLARAGRRLGSLPGPLADAVATSVGWQVRQADVLGGVPDTDRWVVAGRSDRREDRIEVRRHWLRGIDSGRWALVLSFAAYQQSLDTSLEVGTMIRADIHRYPGPALRALVGRIHPPPEATMFPLEAPVGPPPGRPPSQDVAAACDEVGRMLVAEPWLDRIPTSVTAAPGRRGDRWTLGDSTGSLPVVHPEGGAGDGFAQLLALSGGSPVDLTVEWTPHGVVPLAVHVDDRTVDIGPRADAAFVGVA